MKIILENFNFKGQHHKGFEMNFPQVDNVEDILNNGEKMMDYIEESLSLIYDYHHKEESC